MDNEFVMLASELAELRSQLAAAQTETGCWRNRARAMLRQAKRERSVRRGWEQKCDTWEQRTHTARRELHTAERALAEAQRRADGAIRECHDVEQTLGAALGYPRYCDDPDSFPNVTEADGVCVGDHTPASLATEAATRLAEARAVLRELDRAVEEE